MNKALPIILVLAFWGIFLWGMANPKVGDAIIAVTIAGVVIYILYLSKKIIWNIIFNKQ